MFKEPQDQFKPNTNHHLMKGIQVSQTMVHVFFHEKIIEKL